jgi:hypothetical protein
MVLKRRSPRIWKEILILNCRTLEFKIALGTLDTFSRSHLARLPGEFAWKRYPKKGHWFETKTKVSLRTMADVSWDMKGRACLDAFLWCWRFRQYQDDRGWVGNVTYMVILEFFFEICTIQQKFIWDHSDRTKKQREHIQCVTDVTSFGRFP